MRRYRRSHFRAFTNGLLLTALPVAAFFLADYLLTPPAAGTAKPTAFSDHAGLEAGAPVHVASASDREALDLARSGAVAAARDARVADSARAAPTQTTRAPASGQSSLVTAIQQELQRVGCLAGEPDGAWGDRTRVAMQAFNSSVRVNLPTDKPDYILLTLLQGHSSKACSRTCEGGAGRDGTCVDKTIEARAIAPAAGPLAATEKAATASSRQSWTTSVATAPVVVVSPEGVRPGAPVGGAWTAGGGAGSAISGAMTTAAAEGSAGEAAGAEQGTAAVPLPGRMAIGAPPVPTAPAASSRGGDGREARPAPVRTRATAPASGGNRIQRMFTDLNRNSP
jgi:hypothetical protein